MEYCDKIHLYCFGFQKTHSHSVNICACLVCRSVSNLNDICRKQGNIYFTSLSNMCLSLGIFSGSSHLMNGTVLVLSPVLNVAQISQEVWNVGYVFHYTVVQSMNATQPIFRQHAQWTNFLKNSYPVLHGSLADGLVSGECQTGQN